MTTNTCPQCGKKVSDDAIKCYRCGHRFINKGESTPQSTPPLHEKIEKVDFYEQPLLVQNFLLGQIIAGITLLFNYLGIICIPFYLESILRSESDEYFFNSMLNLSGLSGIIILFALTLNITLMLLLNYYLKNFDIEYYAHKTLKRLIACLSTIVICIILTYVPIISEFNYVLIGIMSFFFAFFVMLSVQMGNTLKEFECDYIGYLDSMGEALSPESFDTEWEYGHNRLSLLINAIIFINTPYQSIKIFKQAGYHSEEFGFKQ